jgi:hypothetical protein
METEEQPARPSTVAGSGRRFCPRCGTARIGDMPFCPACGLDLTRTDEPRTIADPGAQEPGAITESPLPIASPSSADPSDADLSGERRSPIAGLRIPPVAVVIVLVLVGLVVLGILRLPIGTSPPAAGQPATNPSGAITAPIVGLAILSPTEGQAVATNEVVVIGTAPPGLSITQDISFGLDAHTNVDGTGHWALKVGLKEGDNVLKFRIGDDHSTEKTVRVIYTPPASS